MVAITVRAAESCERQPQLVWDTIWVQRLDASGGFGDWIMAVASDQAESRGGLRAESALHTATLIQLFTDARRPTDVDPTGDGDPRGWWGDSVKIEGEPDQTMGSLLWTLERAPLTDDTRRRAEDYAADALAVLAEQGAVARTTVAATVDTRQYALLLTVRHYSQAGAAIYDQKFAVAWGETRAPRPMNFGDRDLALA